MVRLTCCIIQVNIFTSTGIVFSVLSAYLILRGLEVGVCDVFEPDSDRHVPMEKMNDDILPELSPPTKFRSVTGK